MCKITYYVWNKIIQGSLSRSVWKKFLSLEKFYTHIVADVADYYEVCRIHSDQTNFQALKIHQFENIA